MWTRREFTRTSGIVLLGGIFVPKFERWFRPLIVPPTPEMWAVLLGHDGTELVRKAVPEGGLGGNFTVTFPAFDSEADIGAMAIVSGKGDRVIVLNNNLHIPSRRGDVTRVTADPLLWPRQRPYFGVPLGEIVHPDA